MEENWRILSSLFPVGWRLMARRCGAIERLRGFSSCEALLRMILLHVGKGIPCGKHATRKIGNWADSSDVALLKRLRHSEEWLRSLCLELLKENGCSLKSDRACADTGGGRHDCQRIGKNGQPVANSVQLAVAQFDVRFFPAPITSLSKASDK